MNNKRVMGLDVGDKTVGIAVSDPLGWTAQPVETYLRKSEKDDILYLKRQIDLYNVAVLIVGKPINLNGTNSIQTDKVLDFVSVLKKDINIEIVLIDERLTSSQANKLMISADVKRKKRKEKIDSLAAVLILQTYLERMSNNNSKLIDN